MIESPKYFHHTGKEDILNNRLKKDLIKFLNDKSKNNRFSTNWEYLVSMWNDNNSKRYVPEDIPIPNYLLLP